MSLISNKTAISFPPIPLFARNWKIVCYDLPKAWEFIIKSALVWALASEKRFRGLTIGVLVRQAMEEDLKTAKTLYGLRQDTKADVWGNLIKLPEMQIHNSFNHAINILKFTPEYNLSKHSKFTVLDLGDLIVCKKALTKGMRDMEISVEEYLLRSFIDASLALLRKENDRVVRRRILQKFALKECVLNNG